MNFTLPDDSLCGCNYWTSPKFRILALSSLALTSHVIALTMLMAISIMLCSTVNQQKKKLKGLQFARQKASKYQATVHTAQAHLQGCFILLEADSLRFNLSLLQPHAPPGYSTRPWPRSRKAT
jgi:hypothetical protein